MAQRHQLWTTDAIAQDDDLPDVRHDDPLYTKVARNHSNAVMGAWMPKNAVDRICASPNPKSEWMLIIGEMLGVVPYETERKNYYEYAQEQDDIDLPDWYGSPDHIAGEMQALSHRVVKGAINEIVAAQYIKTVLGKTVLTTEEAVERHNGATTETELEEAEVDLMTDDGTTWQIKSSKSEAAKVEKADRVLIVNGDETVEEY
jgi:hypothetical protein